MKSIVTYFSATGSTKRLAENLAKAVDADIFEIVPEKSYSSQDLNWNDSRSRTSLEAKDKDIRPAIKNKLSDIDKYEVIFLGFPIWWYTAPKIINTFLESYDLKDKTVVLFATSGGSGLGNTKNDLQKSCDQSTKIISWRVLHSNQSVDSLRDLVKELKL